MSDEVEVKPWMLTGPNVPSIWSWGIAEFDQPIDENGSYKKVKFIVFVIETPTGSERYFIEIKACQNMAEELIKFIMQNSVGDLTIAKTMPEPPRGRN